MHANIIEASSSQNGLATLLAQLVSTLGAKLWKTAMRFKNVSLLLGPLSQNVHFWDVIFFSPTIIHKIFETNSSFHVK